MKEIQRTCVGCRTKKDQKQMTRVIRTAEGVVVVDQSHKINGRGAYVCKNKACVQKVQKSKALDRMLKIQVPQEIYNSLQVEE